MRCFSVEFNFNWVLYLKALGNEFLSVFIANSSGLNKSPDVVLLISQRFVLESESCGIYLSVFVERNVGNKLLSTNAKLLAAVTFNLYVDKFFHLSIEI